MGSISVSFQSTFQLFVAFLRGQRPEGRTVQAVRLLTFCVSDASNI